MANRQVCVQFLNDLFSKLEHYYLSLNRTKEDLHRLYPEEVLAIYLKKKLPIFNIVIVANFNDIYKLRISLKEAKQTVFVAVIYMLNVDYYEYNKKLKYINTKAKEIYKLHNTLAKLSSFEMGFYKKMVNAGINVYNDLLNDLVKREKSFEKFVKIKNGLSGTA